MPEITGELLVKQIKNEQFGRLYFIFGDDSFYKNYYSNLIAKKSVGGMLEDMNLSKIDGNTLSMQQLLDETEQLPVMAQKRCVVICDYDLASKNKDEVTQFKEIVENLPDTTVLVLLLDIITINIKRAEKWGSYLKYFAKVGNLLRCDYLSDAELAKKLISMALKNESRIERSTVSYLAQVCSRDLNNLITEMYKLCAYKKGGIITKADIDLLCAKSVDAKSYDLPAAIWGYNVEKAFKLVDDLFDLGFKPEQINHAIISGFIDVYRVKVAIADGVQPMDIAKDFGYKANAFILNKVAVVAKGTSFTVLRKCLDILGEADEMLKSKPIDKRILIEKTIIVLIETLRGNAV